MNRKICNAISILLILLLSLSALAAQGQIETVQQGATRSYTDDLGRTFTIPAKLQKVALSGPLAQIIIFPLAPDTLVGISNPWDKKAATFFDSKYYNLPVIGQLYGSKGALNPETLLQSGAEIVIDVGEQKKNMTSDLDGLTTQTGIPFVHIDATTRTMGKAYRTLGALLGREAEGEKLATYCEETLAMIEAMGQKVKKARLLYLTGSDGLSVIAKGSYHAEAINIIADNIAIIENPSGKGTGNKTDMEQILIWNPDVIFFAPECDIAASIEGNSAWQGLTAIKEKRYYQVPSGPYNWMGFPPSVQRYLGMLWGMKVLYPETATYDLYAETKRYFSLFYHADLSRETFDELTGHAF